MDIPEAKLKELCLTSVCSVEMFRFNVAHSMKQKKLAAYEKENKSFDDKRFEKYCSKKGYYFYKMYYEPREEWRRRQYLYCRKNRQADFLDECAKEQRSEYLEDYIKVEYEVGDSVLTEDEEFEEINDWEIAEVELDIGPSDLLPSISQETNLATLPDSENFYREIGASSTQQMNGFS